MTRLKHFSLLALLTIAAQGAWGQTETSLSLPDAEDNSSEISENNGQTCDVTLQGRTLYQDGDWNTLCLPFSMTSDQLNSSPLAGATIKQLDESNSNLGNDGKLTLKFLEASTIDAGKPYIVKWFAINSQADWDAFADDIAKGTTSYKGKIVKLNTDIEVDAGKMVGTSEHPFKGIFDGNGHTIKCNIKGDNVQGAAPFWYIQDATIKNVKVTGTVTGGQHCAGLVGFASGNNTITHCEVAATISSSAKYCGGVLGNVIDTSQDDGTPSTATIDCCLFSGSIIAANATVGTICGWAQSGTTQNLDYCVANGTTYTAKSLDIIMGDGTQTKVECYNTVPSSSEALAILKDHGWTDGPKPVMDNTPNLENPVFKDVTIANTNSNVAFTGGTFKGNYAPLTINDNNRNDILLLTSGNKLGYAKTNRTLNAFRAYFEIPTQSASQAQAVSSFVLDFGDEQATAVIEAVRLNDKGETTNGQWYTLDGRRLYKQPTKAGLYINNGHKVIIN